MTTILLVVDDTREAQKVRRTLKTSLGQATRLHRVRQVSDAMRYLQRHRSVGVILSDISLPDARGNEAFASFRRVAADVPVIFIADSHDTTLAVEALQKGAQDYLVKDDLNSAVIARVIRFAIERKKYQDDVTSARAKTRALRQQTRSLRHEQEQLVLINKAKDDFISLASHQLRTPATGVKQYIGMVLEGFAGNVPEHLRPFLSKAYESNERQLAIVNDLLQVAQLDAGNVHLRRRHTNLSQMLLNIVNEQSSKFTQRHQRLDYRPVGEDIVISVDTERMRMVLDNLIDNASKYTPEGRQVVVVIGRAGDEVVISVKDQGVGIADEDLNKVFEKFSRIANSRSDLVGGTGLGLYWAKQIVDLHQGCIEVRSTIGEGSEFVVRLGATDEED